MGWEYEEIEKGRESFVYAKDKAYQKIGFKKTVGVYIHILKVGVKVDMTITKYIVEAWDNDTGKSRWHNTTKKSFSNLKGAKKYGVIVAYNFLDKYAY